MSVFSQSSDIDRIDFEAECDDRTESWSRSAPREALIESFGRFGYKVTLRDGDDVHYCAIGVSDGEYLGRCDCKGWQYHDGPCAHLCTLRKAVFLGQIDIEEADNEHEIHRTTEKRQDGDRR